MIYLDYAATTPVDPTVARLMADYLTADGVFANPGSTTHRPGAVALDAVQRARVQTAAAIGADPREIVFTSGATEANNLAIKGAAPERRARGAHLITCKTEHKAVLDVCRELERDGFQVSYLDPETDGTLDPQRLRDAMRDDTVLVSLMHVNNETGVMHDLSAAAALCRERGALLHVDAAQGAGKLALDVDALGVDLLSLCAHKVYGPKGIGALYVRRKPKVRLRPLLHGGGQERGLRAGTLATHQIVALGAALELARERREPELARLRELRSRFLTGLEPLDGVTLNGSADPRRGFVGIVNLSFAGVAGEALLMDLSRDLAVSAGSACTSASRQPSHVLLALGVEKTLADSSLRFSFGRFTTTEEIDRAARRVRDAVERLRALSPLRRTPNDG